VKKGTTVHPQSTAVTISAETYAAVKAIADKTIGEISPAESLLLSSRGIRKMNASVKEHRR
jgi:hypothetical protein